MQMPREAKRAGREEPQIILKSNFLPEKFWVLFGVGKKKSCLEIPRTEYKEDMRRVMKHSWGTGKKGTRGHEKGFWAVLSSRTSEIIIISCISLPCVISLALLTPGWGIEKTKEGVDLVLNFAGPALQTRAGWLMILAREGQWIMKSRWKSKGGKMKREWRSQSEKEEPIPRDNSMRRLEWKEIGNREWAFGVFSNGKFSVVKWQNSRRIPEVEDVRELLRWMCWMDHTHRY